MAVVLIGMPLLAIAAICLVATGLAQGVVWPASRIKLVLAGQFAFLARRP